MPRYADYDDYDNDDYAPRPRAVPFPTGVRIAGGIWIAFGALTTLGALASFATQAGTGGGAGVGGCGFLIPIAFLIMGVQTVQGSAKGMLGNAIGSIFFGLIYLGLPLLLMWAVGQAPRNVAVPADFLRVIAGVMILAGVALLAAGGLALVNRKEYADWRAAQGLATSPRLTAEQMDYDDDRPRRRRRDYDDR